MITILNTSIITSHGSYTYKACSLEQAKQLVAVAGGYQSAVGHETTAAVISTLLGVFVKMNRIQYQQQPGDTALVFKLKERAPEGKILTAEEIEEIGYEWGVLERTDTESEDAKFDSLAACCPKNMRGYCTLTYIGGTGADKCSVKTCAVWHFCKASH